MKNPRKGPFDLNINLENIPSYASRFKSMDSLGGDSINMTSPEPVDLSVATDAKDLRAKINSGQDARSNPSVILRRRGIRV